MKDGTQAFQYPVLLGNLTIFVSALFIGIKVLIFVEKLAEMRIKNQKANEEKYKELEVKAYDSLVEWYRKNVDEVLKSKFKIMQDALLEFFRKCKKPSSTQVLELIGGLRQKYISKYPDIHLCIKYTNSIDDDNAIFFTVYAVFNEFYTRYLIQENRHPNIDGKPVILDIEITDDEISEYVRAKALADGNFEEI